MSIEGAAGRIHLRQLDCQHKVATAMQELPNMNGCRQLVGRCTSPCRWDVPDGPAAARFFGYGQVLEEGHGHPWFAGGDRPAEQRHRRLDPPIRLYPVSLALAGRRLEDTSAASARLSVAGSAIVL
jgi:hypothetical protein